MAANLYVRELTAPEWIVLATLFGYAERVARDGDEDAQPLTQEHMAETLKPIDAPEALSNLESLKLIEHPISVASNKPMIRHWDLTPKGEAVFLQRSAKAVETLKRRHGQEQAAVSAAINGQRRRDRDALAKLLGELEAARQEPQAEPEKPRRGRRAQPAS